MPRTLADTAKRIIGGNIRAVREGRLGWSQTHAAAEAGVRRDRLNRWETGRELAGTEGLLRLAIAFSCPVDDFLGGVDERYDTIIERRIPADAMRLYEHKKENVRRLAVQLIEAASTGVRTEPAHAASPKKAHGRSARSRAHRTSPKKK